MNWDRITAHIVSGTGWAWQHVRHECDLPTCLALCDWWQEVPTAADQLRRIASFLGLKPGKPGASPKAAPTTPSSEQAIADEAAMAGMPVFQGRPADPALDLIPPATRT